MIRIVLSQGQQALLLLIAGGILTFGAQAAAQWLRRRGKLDVDRAREEVRKAAKTPEKEDDILKALALERAENSKAFMDSLADALEKRRIDLKGLTPPVE